MLLLKSPLMAATAAAERGPKKILTAPLATLAENEKKYQCYYLHRLRDFVCPVCMIFFVMFSNKFKAVYF